MCTLLHTLIIVLCVYNCTMLFTLNVVCSVNSVTLSVVRSVYNVNVAILFGVLRLVSFRPENNILLLLY